MKNEKQQIEKLKEFWTNRNPVHENNANTGEDMFWGTVLCVFEDMNRANGVNSGSSNCNIPPVSGALLTDAQSYKIAQKFNEYCYMKQDDSLAIGAKAIPLILDECLKMLASNDR